MLYLHILRLPLHLLLQLQSHLKLSQPKRGKLSLLAQCLLQPLQQGLLQQGEGGGQVVEAGVDGEGLLQHQQH